MLSRLRTKVSPAALVIALIALFAAIGGGAAIALPGKKVIDKNDLKKNVIASKNVINDGLTGNDIKEGTLQIPASAVPTKVYGVNVNANGSIASSTVPGVSATGSGGGYTVTFPQSVVGCIPVASDDDVPGTAIRTTQPSGATQTNQIFVTFADAANAAFHLIVVCP
jgi:Na+-translocating ferredoxin:NAD+ oxidoreductase RnfG subunit